METTDTTLNTTRISLLLIRYVFVSLLTISTFLAWQYGFQLNVDNRGMPPALHWSELEEVFNASKHGLYQQYKFGSIKGKPFKVSPHILDLFDTKPFVKLTNSTDLNPVFVTANSWSHYNESLDAIGSIQKLFPSSKILYFDWGLYSWQKKSLKQLCKVEVRDFNISDYLPPPLNNSGMRFQILKPLAIAAALKLHPMIVYFDASIRFTSNDFGHLKTHAKQNGGIAGLTTTGNSVFSATHEGVYQYLPTDTRKLKTVYCVQSGSLLIYNTEIVFRNVLYWWCLCDLTSDCVSPIGANLRQSGPRLPGSSMRRYKYHRYDQSVLNVLLANHFNFNLDQYRNKDNILYVFRSPSRQPRLKYCGI